MLIFKPREGHMDVFWMGLRGALGRALLGAVAFSPFACRQPPAKEKEAPTPDVEWEYREASNRLVGEFLEGGWVVSRKPDGTPEHQGEGLIWSGVAMAALPCDLGDQIEATLASAVERHAGALVRIEPLGEYEGGREVTLDGALGFYRGVAERIVRCGRGELWAPIVRSHLDFLSSHGWRLHENVDSKLIPHFDALPDLLGSSVAVATRPSDDYLDALVGDVITWAAAVNAARAACYRVNLGMLIIETLATEGYALSEDRRWQWCQATHGMDIPTVDHFCGRADIKEWISKFSYNEWEYRHQRCGAWESADGDGDRTPGLDLIVGYRIGYGLN